MQNTKTIQTSKINESNPFCVVAVGSTQFEELIQVLDCSEFYSMLESCGIEGILFQLGTGKYRPHMFNEYPNLVVEVHNVIVLE